MRTYVPFSGDAALADLGGGAEREAQLLVCGRFPDKSLTIAESDLDDIVESFSVDTVPIKVEHVSTVLDPFGTVKALWRDGTRLMARIGFDPAAAPLLASRPVKRLSVGLDRDQATGKLSLAEVSLVLKPRLATAALLAEAAEGGEDERDPRDSRIESLQAQLAARDLDARIGALRREGRVVPAIEPMARALLAASGGSARITLADGGAADVADVALRLLRALPPLVNLSETAGAGRGAESLSGDPTEAPPMTPAQIAYCRDILKVDPEKVRAAMTEQARKRK